VTAYLIRRAGTSLVILIGISVFVFALLHSVFPSPAIVILGPKASPQAVAAFNAQNGYDEPVIGIYQAVRRSSVGDQAVTAVAFTAYAMPGYLLSSR
jgi:ABC-type dipeptide/oligopeptide/nickel transport system permease component